MRRQHPAKKLLCAFVAAALIWTGFVLILPASAAGGAGGDYIVKFKESAAWLQKDGSVPFQVVSEAEALRLDRAGLLEWYEPDGEGFFLEEAAELTDPGYYESYQWNLDVVQAGEAFARGHLGTGVRVGVVDSGVNPHPDLEDRLLPGHNYMEDAGDPADTSDKYGHGTSVAGLIAGAGEHGYIGVAPGAEIVPLKITDGKIIKVSAICLAIYGGIDDYGCDILNLSLGVNGEFESLKEAVAYAETQNVTLVAAVGNNGRTNAYYPASYESVVGVGAVDSSGGISSRSNHNESVFLTAPGIDVRSTDASGSYSLHNGTSFAVPQVAGAVAVMLGLDSTLTPADIRAILAQTAADRGAEGYDHYYGYGILNVAGCTAALEGENDAPDFPCTFSSASELRNDTDRDIRLTYLLAVYDDSGRCLEVRSWPLTVPAGGSAAIEVPEEDTFWGQFVFETATMTPLARARKTIP